MGSPDAVEDRSEAAGIRAGHVDRGEQNDRRLEPHRVREGQRQHDAHHEPKARQNRDGRADKKADKQTQRVHPRSLSGRP